MARLITPESSGPRRCSNLQDLLFFGLAHPLRVADVPLGHFIDLVLGAAFIVFTDEFLA